jgi:hypothetical protein
MPRNQLIQIRRDTTENWTTENPTPAAGEPVFDIDTGYMKIGDGNTPYCHLPAFAHGKNIDVVGIEWDQSSTSPTLKHIDVNGNELTSLDTNYFDNHVIWGNMWRCTIDPATNNPVYGTNARGDGLTLDGTEGNVFVSIPKFYVKAAFDGTAYRWWISPTPLAGFELHPAFLQRGGTKVNKIYVSAYDAAGYLDDSAFKLKSATGLTPVTGGVSYTDLPNSGKLTVDDAEAYANNIGEGYGCMNIWTLSALRLLFYTEYASLDSQTALGLGVVDLASGENFAGVLCGADSADTNIGVNGTGTGTGTNGQTPIVYRGIENLWGNVYDFIIGYNAVDAEYRITKADGTGALAGDLATGEYDVSSSAPIQTDGYQSGLDTDDTLALLFIPGAAVGSSSTYLCDYLYAHDAGETNILLFGGGWSSGSSAGVGSLYSTGESSSSYRNIGARFEFIPQR